MHGSFRHRLLSLWSGLISRHPWWVLFIAFVSVVLCAVYTAKRLTFQPDRNDLLAHDIPWNKTFIDWQQSFPGGNDLIIVVDTGGPAAAPKARALVDELVAELKKLQPANTSDPRVEHLFYGFDPSAISPKMIRTLPRAQFDARIAELTQSKALIGSESPPDMIGKITAELNKTNKKDATPPEQAAVVQQLDGLNRFISAIATRIEPPKTPSGEWKSNLNSTFPPSLGDLVAGDAVPKWQYLESPSGSLLFIRITPTPQLGELNEYALAIDTIRNLMSRVGANHPDVQFGLTGIRVLENDETEAATFDTAIASIISFILITGMLVTAFHSWKTPMLAMLALLVGLAWSYGILTLTIGHLQVISVIFAPMLLGISDAYGVHLASHLELVRHDHPDDSDGFAASLNESFKAMGPGILTGAFTTAAAFATTLFTQFKGVAEMGAISAMGILLCLLAMFSVYPALLRLTKSRHKHIKPMEDRFIHFYEEKWSLPFSKHPKYTLTAAAILTGVSILALTQMTYDFNLQKLFPRGFESVKWQNRITEEGGVSVWNGVSVCKDMEEARKRTEELRSPDIVKKNVIAEVGGVGVLFPPDDALKGDRLLVESLKLESPSFMRESTGTRIAIEADRFPSRDQLAAQLSLLQAGLKLSVPADAPLAVREGTDQLAESMGRVLTAINRIDATQRAARLDGLDNEFRQWRDRTYQSVKAALHPSPLTLADLPLDLRRLYTDKQGRVVLEIHPHLGDDPQLRAEGPLSPKFLPRFVETMKRVDPDITGPAPQIYHSGILIKESYIWAGLYALIVVFILVYLDFRRVDDAFMALVPVAVGFACTFGVMWVLGIMINPANIIVLPLMFGIGVDAGVHMLHRFRQDPDTRPLGLTDGTGKAITVTTLTTVVGFGTLMFASHRGIASLGFVLTIGILLSMFACWTVMPAMLEMATRKRAKKREGEVPPEPVRL